MPSTDPIAFLALIVSIIAAFFTHFMYRKEIKNQGYQLAMGMFIEVDRVFIEYPQTRRYFYDGVSVPDGLDPAEEQRIMAVSEMMLDICELVTDTRLGLKAGDEESWRNYVTGCLQASPTMVEHLTDHPDWHPRTYRLYLSRVIDTTSQENA